MRVILKKLRRRVSNSTLLQRYTTKYNSHYAGTNAKKKMLVDFFLLLCATAIPIAMISWHSDSKQKQLTRLPLVQYPYINGSQVINAKGQIFRDKKNSNSLKAMKQQEWMIRCGRLRQTLHQTDLSQNSYTQKPYKYGWPTKTDAITEVKLLCENGAQVGNATIQLKTQYLFYHSNNDGHKISTESPLEIQIDEITVNSARGGVMQPNGEITLLENVVLNAPNITIRAKQQAQLQNITAEKQRAILFEKRVVLQYKNATSHYKGLAELAEVIPCQKKTPKTANNCQVFGITSLQRIILNKKVILQQYDLQQDKASITTPVWTLKAQRVIMQGDQAQYQGSSKHPARIVFANGTEIYGEQGGHNIIDNSGILCGSVQVRLTETNLESPCLRYNLNNQLYRLEPKTVEQELAQQFFSLDE